MKPHIHPKVKKLAKHFGIQFRWGETPEDAKILGVKLPKGFVAGYFGEGIVYIKTPPRYKPKELQIVLLHEIGHAILDFYPLKISRKMHELKANAIALGFAAQLRLPVNERFITSMNIFTRSKGTRMSEIT